MRNHLFPLIAARVCHRYRHQPEVPALVVGTNEKLIAMMVDAVLLVLYPWRNHGPFARGLVRALKPHFTRRVTGTLQHHVIMAERAEHANVETLVRILVHDCVARGRRSY